jgi:hypothetical protein
VRGIPDAVVACRCQLDTVAFGKLLAQLNDPELQPMRYLRVVAAPDGEADSGSVGSLQQSVRTHDQMPPEKQPSPLQL